VGPLAYRHWALTHRAEFNLIFTDQLPGYEAEPGGATVDAQMAIFRPMTEALSVALADSGGPQGEALKQSIGLWGLFHGLVSLEVNNHLDWLDAEGIYEDRLRWALDAFGLPAARSDLAADFLRWVSSDNE